MKEKVQCGRPLSSRVSYRDHSAPEKSELFVTVTNTTAVKFFEFEFFVEFVVFAHVTKV